MAERSIATDCKSVALWATKVRILPCAQNNSRKGIFCYAGVRLNGGREGFEKVLPYFRAILIVRKWETCTAPVRGETPSLHVVESREKFLPVS